MTRASEFREKYGVQAIASLLIGLGFGTVWWTGLTWREVGRTAGDALLIAGILAFVVDPFLKKELLHEASLGSFKHMLGFDHEPEVKDRLHEIVSKTKVYVRDKRIHCKIEAVNGDNSRVRLIVTQSWSVDNPTPKSITYPVGLAFEQSENPSKAIVRVITKSGDAKEIASFGPDANEPGVIRTRRDPVEVPPGRDDVRIEAEYVLENQPNPSYHDFVTATPLIDVMVSVDSPDDLEVHVSPGFTEAQGNTWRYRQLLMPGEKVTIRWFPKNHHSVHGTE